MATLDRWRSFLQTPKVLNFPRLELRGRDHEPPIVVGEGEVRLPSLSRFEFILTGTPADVDYAFAQAVRLERNPYDPLARFRLIGVDADGVEWQGGYTTPTLGPGKSSWGFAGKLDGLSTDDHSNTVLSESCTEVIFMLPIHHPMVDLAMRNFVRTEQRGARPLREYVLNILGSTIRFAYEPSPGILSITASHSSELPAPYTENWLGEPLRILFGQLIYPRLVARNFGDGRAMVSVRRSPPYIPEAGKAALWCGEGAPDDKALFWSLYEQLLSLIARAHDFDANELTRFYEEVIQAAYGSRWVWALTCASSIEGLAKTLIPKNTKRADANAEAIQGLVSHIKRWSGPANIKDAAVRAVHRSAEVTTIHILRELKTAGVITPDQLSAWEKLRNAVMHGNLVSPFSSREEDARLLALAEMMHGLAREVIRTNAHRA